ncbi:hypothetical protein GX553_02270 [Candidatus Peribacteria bacterium]|nr:hypothetical protein [Candidatus Peribacteria bacterium]
MDILEKLQKGLEDGCRKLHKGESVQMAMSPQVDANAIQAIRGVVEKLYRDMFQEELQIEEMRRDEYGVLHISVAKNREAC